MPRRRSLVVGVGGRPGDRDRDAGDRAASWRSSGTRDTPSAGKPGCGMVPGLGDPAGFASDWQPADRERAGPAGRRHPPPTRRPGRHPVEAPVRSPGPGVVLAVCREEPHGHPPFYALLGLAGDVLAPSWRDLPRARLGPILLFSLTAGVIFPFVAARWGHWPAALGRREAGSFSRTCSATDIMPPTTPCCHASGSWRSLRLSGGRPRRNGCGAAMPMRWAWTVVRADPGLRRGDEADRLVPARCRSWLGRSCIAAGWPSNLCSRLVVAAVVLFVLMPPWWTRAGRRALSISSTPI